jgi:hypothetical protein
MLYVFAGVDNFVLADQVSTDTHGPSGGNDRFWSATCPGHSVWYVGAEF